MEKKNQPEGTDDATGFEIKEFPEVSFDENDDVTGVGESKESSTRTESGSIEEPPEYSRSRSKVDEEYDRDIAQQKKNRIARAQPGAKRGGRRDTGRSASGRRFRGKKKTQFQAGDLVEAEWAGSGWWYVGYVSAGAERNGAAGMKPGKWNTQIFRITFIDGDEADVPGKDLKLLGTTGEPAGNRDTALPRHVPVVDLGPGHLHGNREPHSTQRKNAGGKGKAIGDQSNNGHRNKNDNTNGVDDDNDIHQEIHQESGVEGTTQSPLPRRVSIGNIKDRVRQGKDALWGGRGAPDGKTRGSSDGGGGDWWNTGTPYAFQPRLVANKTTVLSFVGTAGRRDRGVGLNQRGGLRENIGGGDDYSAEQSRTDSVASAISVQHQQHLQGGRGTSRELMRIVKVPESHEHHGQRVFFLA